MDKREALRRVFTCIDNTTLEGSDTHEKVAALCRKSIELQDSELGIEHVAAVCVYPVFVRQASDLLRGSGIKVASVAGAFPAGQSPLSVKLSEVQYALEAGADEIDMVISRGSLLEGDFEKVRGFIFNNMKSLIELGNDNIDNVEFLENIDTYQYSMVESIDKF